MQSAARFGNMLRREQYVRNWSVHEVDGMLQVRDDRCLPLKPVTHQRIKILLHFCRTWRRNQTFDNWLSFHHVVSYRCYDNTMLMNPVNYVM